MGIIFEWDQRKAKSNLRKHGVSFEEAATIFADRVSVTIHDPDHSTDEDRYVMVGFSIRQRLLVVVHCDRRDRDRIIGARRATTQERRHYEEGR